MLNRLPDRERVLRTLTFWLRPRFALTVVNRIQKVGGFDRATHWPGGARSCAPPGDMDAHPLFGGSAFGDDRITMDAEHAWVMAARLHVGELEEDGTPLLAHVRRVAAMVPAEARTVAWLHEALETTSVAEEDLLLAGLTSEQLRALRLLNLKTLSRSDRAYLAHLELIARSAGQSGRLARIVKLADLRDRCAHPRVRRSGWSPPYAQGLQLLTEAADGHAALAAEVG